MLVSSQRILGVAGVVSTTSAAAAFRVFSVAMPRSFLACMVRFRVLPLVGANRTIPKRLAGRKPHSTDCQQDQRRGRGAAPPLAPAPMVTLSQELLRVRVTRVSRAQAP